MNISILLTSAWVLRDGRVVGSWVHVRTTLHRRDITTTDLLLRAGPIFNAASSRESRTTSLNSTGAYELTSSFS